jgi:hypothetical protein
MTQEGEALAPHSGKISNPGKISNIEGQAVSASSELEEGALKDGETLPPQAIQALKLLMESTEMRASFGPDPETAKIIAETERHAEEKKLEGYKATLEHRDKQSQRDQDFRMQQLRHSALDRRIVLFSSLIALAGGAALSFRGDPQLGNPIMSAALTLLITLITGKLKVGE